MNALILQLEEAMDLYWDELANGGTPSDEVYYIAQELEQEHGIGAVYIPTMKGRMAWFDLAEMAF